MKELTRWSVPGNGVASPVRPRPRRRSRLYWVAAAIVVVAAAIAAAWILRPRAGTQYLTATVVRKTLVESVTATGTVNPQDTILVGSQVSGTIAAIYADYNDYVHKGQILTRLDPTLFQAAVDQSRGTVAQAQSQYQAALAAESSAQADVIKARGTLSLARVTVQRDLALLHNGYVAQSQYDADYSNLVTAQSALTSSIAAATQAGKTAAADENAVTAAEATLSQALINLSHTVITSPTDGTVIQRNVSLGQTVAASFQTPTLFTIGKDLAKMEIDLNVGEPDIGNVRAGDPVDFSVLAYPNAVFHGIVAQVRENPTTVQNVVTYDTVVYENNRNGLLRPGMTPTAYIQVAEAKNAIVVPVAALTFAAAQQGQSGLGQHRHRGERGIRSGQYGTGVRRYARHDRSDSGTSDIG
jgi:HlyD family secretion protein